MPQQQCCRAGNTVQLVHSSSTCLARLLHFIGGALQLAGQPLHIIPHKDGEAEKRGWEQGGGREGFAGWQGAERTAAGRPAHCEQAGNENTAVPQIRFKLGDTGSGGALAGSRRSRRQAASRRQGSATAAAAATAHLLPKQLDQRQGSLASISCFSVTPNWAMAFFKDSVAPAICQIVDMAVGGGRRRQAAGDGGLARAGGGGVQPAVKPPAGCDWDSRQAGRGRWRGAVFDSSRRAQRSGGAQEGRDQTRDPRKGCWT